MQNTAETTDQSTFPVLLNYRCTKLRIQVEKTCRVLDLKTKIQELLDIPIPFLTLLVAGRKLQDDQLQLFPLFNQQKGELPVFVLASSPEAVQRIQQSKSDPLMRPLEPQKVKNRVVPRNNTVGGQKQLFCKVAALEGFADRQKAQEILEHLASERGVVAVVKKYSLSVTRITEMFPHGKVGVDPVCVLGLNKGNEIQLRLRTDDLQGFRSYDKILQVLFHELAHCRYAEHNREFYAFMKQLEKEAEAADWTKHGGRRLVDAATSVQVTTQTEESSSTLSYKGVLGGEKKTQSPREAAAQAAMARAKTTNEKDSLENVFHKKK